ncbi:hypothetical protein V5O48_015622 [Marasmius crinis-equi]|uniref:Uncharacterized protein n=1 Tax=Marasmius crinis-equi TaxID=585013 RepID=A0ABR3EU31_9AGAR
MPRPKLYSSIAQRREANRLKNKRFYEKNRTKILKAKKLKRENEQQAQEREEIRQRKKRKKKLEGVDNNQTEIVLEVPLVSAPPDPVEKHLEDRLEHLKNEYRKQIKPRQ